MNERIKDQTQDFVFGAGITRGKILAAMLFGMFIAILNQTLLNVALPRINTEFNICFNWAMVDDRIHVSKWYFNNKCVFI